ncbi:uncharacterized protein l(3)mbt [Eurosta solidaginis]|uniref:uncharacterized protein l(3)mbt n=1 Tax=Eurosta solidaginis TaxID=178769 RepID=UPI0035314DEC
MNINGDSCTTLGTNISNIITTGDNHNNTLTFMPQMTFITSADVVRGPTQFPCTYSDLATLQQTTSCASPMISVITSTNNNSTSTTSNQHNTQSFLIPSGVPNNSILTTAAPMGVTPINVIIASNSSTVNPNMNNASTPETSGPVGKRSINTPIMESKSNSVMPTSVLICNRPQYTPHLHGSYNKSGTPTRNNIYPNPTQMTTIFNPELVKQIVVGNAPKNSVITAASAKKSTHAATSNTSQTLLKSSTTAKTTNAAAMKHQAQHSSNKPSTTPISQAPLMSTLAVTTTSSGSTTNTQITKNQTSTPTTNNTLPQNTKTTSTAFKTTSILQTAFNSKVPLAEAAKAVAVASISTKSSKTGELVDTLDIPTERGESKAPSPKITSKVEPQSLLSSASSIQQNVSVIKTTSNLNQTNDVSSVKTATDQAAKARQNMETTSGGECCVDTLKVDNNQLIKPILAQSKLIEKQESLLKTRPIQTIIDCNTSPRSKRSKSLSSGVKDSSILEKGKPQFCSLTTEQQSLSERRHSTASESDTKRMKQNSSPPRRKQLLITTKTNSSDITKEYDIIDLIDYNEEERNIIERQLKKIDLAEEEDGEEEKSTVQHALTNNITKQHDFKDVQDVKAKAATKKTPIEEKEESNLNSSNGNIDEENELTEGSSIKIEIVVEDAAAVEDAPQLKPQQSQQSNESVDIIYQDTKAEDTQTSVEHTQDSIEKSLYCDEKISISSTSTSSSRQSLHDDTLPTASHLPSSSLVVSHKHGYSHHNLSSKSANLPSTSAAAAAAAEISVKSSSSLNSTENSMSCALKMLANFNMLTWNQRIGSARGTNMRFQLNEFNLIEINERCSPRTRIHTAYEKPIYERESVPNLSEKNKGLLYLCRQCNCHGPALDFLAPEFCSLDCLKRDSRKRRNEEYLTAATKRRTTSQEAVITQLGCKKSFRWSTYLPEKFNAIAAPVNLFINPFPTGSNKFQIGMKLEAIDPENCSLFCVCTIVDIQGYRMKLTFDGYEYMYDFWVNADSMDIFPPGWCAKTKRILQPPKGKTAEEFSWSPYLIECKAIAAQRVLFTHLNASLGTHNPFKIGMHLEAEDLNDTGKLCVASIADVLDNRIRVHFDGWDDCYDYWVDISSPYIHPCGWHVGRQQLIVPPEFENTSFTWNDYIKTHGSGMAATEEMFSTRFPIDFKPNMKLEVVDPRNPSLIRPATVVGRKGHRVKLHLDCWASNYCFWLEDDSADLHPIGWCEATGHELEPPPGYKMRTAKIVCSTYGCRGIGNAKRLYLNTHTTRDCCPYAPDNWRQKEEKPPRLEHDEIVRIVAGSGDKQREQQEKKELLSLQWKHFQQQQRKQQHNLQQQQNKQKQLNEAQILQQIQLLDNIKTRHVIQQEKQQQQKQIGNHRTHGNDIPNTTTQKKSIIKTEPADKPPQQPTTTATKNVDESSSLLLPQIKIAKEFLYDYGPRLQQNYTIWQRNCAFDMQRIKRNPLFWSTKDTCAFVQCVLRNADTTERFLREDIDGNALLLLQQSDLTEMLKLKLGPAVKLYSCILQLRTLTAIKFDVKLRNEMQKKH